MRGKLTRSVVRAMNAVDNQDKIPIIVKYREGLVTTRAFVDGARPKYHYGFFRGAAWDARPREVATLAAAPEIERIWLDLPVHTCLDSATARVNAPQAWNLNYTGQGIRIAIIDTESMPVTLIFRAASLPGSICAGAAILTIVGMVPTLPARQQAAGRPAEAATAVSPPQRPCILPKRSTPMAPA